MNRSPKTALVLAGGGIAGAVYEIGALRAIDEMLVKRTVNDFDIYVGTSAGALVNAFVCNGFTPSQIMQLLDNRHPELRSFAASDVFHMNWEGLARRWHKWPLALWNIGRKIFLHGREVALLDLLWEWSEVLPSGLYNGAALEQYVSHILLGAQRANRFHALAKDLYIVATELDNGERAVFSRYHQDEVPISLAVAASSAIPLLYQPVEIHGQDYVDGGLQGAASLDLAIEAGAELVVCVNPMTPLDATTYYPGQHYIRERGFQAIINQSVRTLFHSSVRYHIKNLRVKYPEVDIILIQPHWDDYRMFAYNPMNYSSRVAVAEHGYKTVMQGMRRDFHLFQTILARHNITLNAETAMRDMGDAEAIQPLFPAKPEATKSRTSLDDMLNELENNLKQLDRFVGQPDVPTPQL